MAKIIIAVDIPVGETPPPPISAVVETPAPEAPGLSSEPVTSEPMKPQVPEVSEAQKKFRDKLQKYFQEFVQTRDEAILFKANDLMYPLIRNWFLRFVRQQNGVVPSDALDYIEGQSFEVLYNAFKDADPNNIITTDYIQNKTRYESQKYLGEIRKQLSGKKQVGKESAPLKPYFLAAENRDTKVINPDLLDSDLAPEQIAYEQMKRNKWQNNLNPATGQLIVDPNTGQPVSGNKGETRIGLALQELKKELYEVKQPEIAELQRKYDTMLPGAPADEKKKANYFKSIRNSLPRYLALNGDKIDIAPFMASGETKRGGYNVLDAIRSTKNPQKYLDKKSPYWLESTMLDEPTLDRLKELRSSTIGGTQSMDAGTVGAEGERSEIASPQLSQKDVKRLEQSQGIMESTKNQVIDSYVDDPEEKQKVEERSSLVMPTLEDGSKNPKFEQAVRNIVERLYGVNSIPRPGRNLKIDKAVKTILWQIGNWYAGVFSMKDADRNRIIGEIKGIVKNFINNYGKLPLETPVTNNTPEANMASAFREVLKDMIESLVNDKNYNDILSSLGPRMASQLTNALKRAAFSAISGFILKIG